MNPQNRVIQLDSHLLDDELSQLLDKQLDESVGYLKLSQYKDEFQLGLSLLLFKLTTWRNSTYGLRLHNLSMVDSPSGLSVRKKLLLLSLIIGRYAYRKFNAAVYSRDQETSKLWLERLSKLFQVAEFANFLSFITLGQYPNLVYRLLGIQLKKLKLVQEQSETISFEFQNRQLIWNTLTEFLMFIVPKFNLSWLQNSQQQLDPNLKFLPERVCVVCYAGSDKKELDANVVVNPHTVNCGHVFCYTCCCNQMELARRSGRAWKCPRCEEDVEYAKPI